MTRLLLLALLLAPLATVAQIYRTVDEHGNVIFSDTPPEGAEAEEVELLPLNTAPPPVDRPDLEPEPEKPAKQPAAVRYEISIASPANETSIPMGPGNFSVTAAVTPSLRSGHTLQLFVDAEPWGGPQASPSWALTNVFRGAHDLTVAVLNAEGKQLTVSRPVRVYVFRPSVLFPNRN